MHNIFRPLIFFYFTCNHTIISKVLENMCDKVTGLFRHRRFRRLLKLFDRHFFELRVVKLVLFQCLCFDMLVV